MHSAALLPPALSKYLRRRAAAGPWEIAGNERRGFAGAVVIPALAETRRLPATLASLAANPAAMLEKFLVVVVVNQRRDAPKALRDENLATLELLKCGDLAWQGLHLGWVDAASPGRELPPGEGVGLARKIGMDLALSRLDWSGSPVLLSLDADTLVQDNYLAALHNHFARAPQGGAVIPFCHQPAETPEGQQAMDFYELYLHHYVLGLRLANSPYAFHSLGSALACRASAYVAAGGMNRRCAGEDFYFLQQLAKTSGVARLSGTLVRPSARLSSRTPFGTGPAMARLHAGEQPLQFIGADAFSLLGRWLALVSGHLDQSAEWLLQQAGSLSAPLAEFLHRERFSETWLRLCANFCDPRPRERAFHQWFDGLRSRRLLHQLTRANPHPTDCVASLAGLCAWAGIDYDEDIGILLAKLMALEGIPDGRPAEFHGARSEPTE